MQEAKLECPADLVFNEHVFSVSFSPTQDIVACGLINGEMSVYHYTAAGSVLVGRFNHHTKACRALAFTGDGSGLFSTSRDKSIGLVDLNTKQLPWKQDKAHASGINAMALNGNFLYTGDDDGIVKVWDTRQRKNVFTIEENDDFIADFLIHKGLLFSASGDGTVSIYDPRKGTLKNQSEPIEDEFLSLTLMKNDTKVVVGTQSGSLCIFTYDEWEDPTDKFIGHPESVDCMIKINEDIMCTGSSDGLIRVVNILPNQLLGVVGEHEEYPVERMSISRDKKYLASCSHDNKVKFWNLSIFFEEGGDAIGSDSSIDSDAEEDKNDVKMNETKLEETLVPKEKQEMTNFFADL